jgi:hypothetical protein
MVWFLSYQTKVNSPSLDLSVKFPVKICSNSIISMHSSSNVISRQMKMNLENLKHGFSAKCPKLSVRRANFQNKIQFGRFDRFSKNVKPIFHV